MRPMRRASDHGPGDCPKNYEKILSVEQRLDDGAVRMEKIEASLVDIDAKFDKHVSLSSETNASVLEVLEIIKAGKGFFKVIGWIVNALKYMAPIAAAFATLWFTLKDGMHK